MPVELETLKLELPLLRKPIALRLEPRCVVRCLPPEAQLALELLLRELLVFESLLQLEGVESPRVFRRELRCAAADALLELKVERILLLLELQLPVLNDAVGCACGHAVQRSRCTCRAEQQA